MNEKECTECKVVKPLYEFSKLSLGKYGRASKCKECKKEYDAQRYQNNREKILEYRKQYNQEHKEEKSKYDKQYKKEHKEEINEYQKNRYHNDPAFALRDIISVQVRNMLKSNGGSKAGESILQYLPYTKEELVEHLEKQFEPGMTWENHSVDGWHIDHIYPQSLLPYESMDHPNFLKAWALENLQPLWAKENISKGNKIL